MSINDFACKITKKIWFGIILGVFQYPRILKYKLLSNCKNIIGKPIYNQPALLVGNGAIEFGKNVTLGYIQSPHVYNGYGYIDARKKNSKIVLGDNVLINNNVIIISEGEGIEIGAQTLIGLNVEIIDSNFHDLHPERRISGMPKTAKVTIGKNVFIGSNVKILKGVTIGDNSIIANGTVVTKTIPANVIAGGNPAVIIQSISIGTNNDHY